MGSVYGSERSPCLVNDPYTIILLLISLTEIVFLIPLLIYGFIGSLKTNLPSSFKFTYWFTCFIVFMAGITFPMQQLFDHDFSGYCLNFPRILIMAVIPFAFYQLCLILITVLYFIRLTSLNISLLFTLLLTFGIFCQFALFIAMTYLNYSVWYRFIHAIPFAHLWDQTFDTYLAFNIINLIENILLLILFVRKVLELGKSIKMEESDEKRNILTVVNLTDPIVIYILTLSVAMISSLTQTLFGYTRSNLYADTDLSYSMHLTLFSLDVFMNYLSLILQFTYTRPLFNKCCGCCYNKCINWIVHKSSVVNDIEDQYIQNIIHTKMKKLNSDSTIRTSKPTDLESTSTNATTNDSVETTYSQIGRVESVTQYNENDKNKQTQELELELINE
eukprot:288720_1